MARHASENASRTLGGCPQSVESAVLRAFEDASRTPGSLFEHGTHIRYRKSLFLVPSPLTHILVDLFFVDISIPWYN